MPTWLDEQYTAMAAVTLAGFAYILARFGSNAPPSEVIAVPPRSRRSRERSRARR